MPTYDVATGSAGTVRIGVTLTPDAPNNRTLFAFYFQVLCSNPATFFSGKSWSGSFAGTPVSGSMAMTAGSGGTTVYSNSFYVAHDANGNASNVPISFTIGTTGTGGVGGPTGNSQSVPIARILNAPGAPGQATASSVTSTTASMAWTAATRGSSAITDYGVYLSIDPAFGSHIISAWEGIILSRALTGLARGTQHYFRTRARNADGTGAYSATRSFTTLHTVPDAPVTPTLNSKTSTTLALNVTDPAYVGAGVTARETQLSTSSTFAGTPLSDSTTTPAFSSLTRFTQYYARYRVTDAIGVGAWSPTFSVMTDAQPPSAPTGYAASDITSTTAYVGGGSVPDNGGATITDLRVEYNTSASSSGSTIVTVGANRAAFLEGLTPGTTYWAREAVANGASGGGWGPYGSWISFTTKSNVPGPPTGLAASLIHDNDATLSWVTPANLYGSTVISTTLRVAADAAFSSGLQVLSLSSSDLSELVSGLLSGTTYYAQVWRNSNNGIGSYSSVISFTTTGVAPAAAPVWMRIAGVWKSGTLWMKIAGVWKSGTLWQRVAGVWKS